MDTPPPIDHGFPMDDIWLFSTLAAIKDAREQVCPLVIVHGHLSNFKKTFLEWHFWVKEYIYS